MLSNLFLNFISESRVSILLQLGKDDDLMSGNKTAICMFVN